MAARTFAVGVLALCLVAGCAGQLISGQDVQEFVNEQSLKVAKVQNVVALEYWSLFEQIKLSLNNVALQWHQIDKWGNQQSRWDLLVQLADDAVGNVLLTIPKMPSTGKPPLEWGSKNPKKDLEEVAYAICEQIAALEPYAREEYEVDLNLTTMTNCAKAASDIEAFSVDASGSVESVSASLYLGAEGPAAAPGPAPGRRLLSA